MQVGLALQILVHSKRGDLKRRSQRWGINAKMFQLPFDYGRRTVAEHDQVGRRPRTSGARAPSHQEQPSALSALLSDPIASPKCLDRLPKCPDRL